MEKVEKELFGDAPQTNYHKVVTGIQDKNTISEVHESDSSHSHSSSDEDEGEDQEEG